MNVRLPMKKTSFSSLAFIALVAVSGSLALTALSSGCASTRTSDSTGEYVDDTVITTKVKSALLGDEAVKSFAISVETVKGVVQLSGFVNNADQKSAAGRAASAVPGVKQVHNNLIVK
jgi:hyperosmotically inducible periplasmic protein